MKSSPQPSCSSPADLKGADRAIRLAKVLFSAQDARITPADGVDGAHWATDQGAGLQAHAPIRRRNGAVLGVLEVRDPEPRAFDSDLMAGLELLAKGVADDNDPGADELEETRALLTAFVESVPATLAMTDREFRVLKASSRLLASFGLREDEVIGQSLVDLSPNAYSGYRAALQRCLAGETLREERVRSERSATPRWHQLDLTPWRTPGGDIGGVMIASHDVTGIVDAMEAARRSEDRLQVAIELTGTQTYEFDFGRREVTADTGLLASEDWGDFEDATKRIWDIIHPDDLAGAQELWDQHIGTGVPYKAQYRVRRTDGGFGWVEAVSRAIPGFDGASHRVVGAVRDIDGDKRNELELVNARDASEAANRAKSAFLATMSHEIRTPLNGVLGMAQAMDADDLNPSQRERLDVIRQSGESLLAILNDVLDLSKIEAGKLDLEETEFSIGEVARGAYGAYTALAVAKGLAFDLRLTPPARGRYLGDPTRVRQILYNLISNALKFTERGEVAVRVETTDFGLRLAVRDSGVGIPADRLETLFLKFEQADTSTTRRFGGTGLGLAICRELTELMGGSIHATSVEGQGSEFRVDLPLVRIGEADEDDARPARAPEPRSTPAAIRVLAAEDNAVNQLVIRTLLEQVGVEATIVGDGAQALEAWEREAWDLILMDIQMPVMDGPTATREIRRRESAKGRTRTPIIALTANAMAHQTDDYLAAGMDAIVAKPIDAMVLFHTLQSVLDDAAAEAERAA